MMLSCAIDGGDPAVAELVRKLGAEGAWAKIIEGMLGEPTAQRAARVTVEVFQRLGAAAAARFIVPGDEEWPAGLGDLRHAESIQRRGGEPVGLWLRGPGHLAHLMERLVAIVGSRRTRRAISPNAWFACASSPPLCTALIAARSSSLIFALRD